MKLEHFPQGVCFRQGSYWGALKVTNVATVNAGSFHANICIFSRDETIRSSHDTIRIDTKGDDMVIFDTVRYNTDNNCKNTNIHNVYIYTNIHNVHIILFMNTTKECFD